MIPVAFTMKLLPGNEAEYEKRLVEIERIEKDAYEAYQDFLKKKARQKQDLFHELESDTLVERAQDIFDIEKTIIIRIFNFT